MDSYSFELLNRSLHDTVDKLCGYPVDLVTDYSTEGMRLFKYMQNVLRDLMSTTPDIESVRKTQIKQKLENEYQCSTDFSEDLAKSFLIRRKDIQNYMSLRLLSEYSLTNFNWSISSVLSSSLKSEMKEPLLHLQLNVNNNQKETQVILEFNYDELCKFIEVINEIKDRCLGY